MIEKVWELKERKFDDLVDQLLYNRGIFSDKDEIKKLKFFKPNFSEDLYDPYLMTDMKGAVERIRKAVENKEKIGVFSDYDADGIPGAALMYRALKALDIEVSVYIPNREGGYGLSREGIDHLAKQGCTLIITIDLGIRNLTEPAYCQEKGIDLIITDHHLPGEELPKANFVINPKRSGDKYPFKELCGCAVGYKLIQGLSKHFPKELDEKFLKWNLDLVAISTISDVVPLSGENRVLVKYGLMVLKKTKNLGLQELYKVSNIQPENVGAYTVGFQIGPRINAPGRMDSATKSFELLITEDEKEAKELAVSLNEKNEERQSEMDILEKEAIKVIEEKKLFENKIIIISGKWTKGIIGPTASRLVEKYSRPVIIFSLGKDGYTGSARSVSGVNIVELLEKVKELIEKYGGHKGAAGLSVSKENFEDFVASLTDISNKDISEANLVKKVSIDAEVAFSNMSFKLFEELSQFEPFGLANPRPIFMTKNISFDSFRFVGKDSNHFSALAKEKNSKIKSIYFNFPFEKSMINYDKYYSVAFSLNQDEWQGDKKLSLNIIDIKPN
jgi:single-stranded-DNA-specific exonuclease